MGTNVDADLNLKFEEVPYNEFTVDDIDNLADSMSKGYYSILSKNRELALDQKEKDIASSYDSGENQLARAAYPNTDYKSYAETLGDTITNLQYALGDEGLSINAKVRTDYNNILNLSSNVLSRKLDYEEAQILLNSEKAKLKVGMSTQSSCDAAEEKLQSAACEYNKAKLDYFISVEKFKYYVSDFI